MQQSEPMEVVIAIPLDNLVLSSTNPRQTVDALRLEELASSIRELGVQIPIIVRPLNGDGKFEIVAGSRRFLASASLGLQTIPALVRDMSDQQVLETQITENLQREGVHPLDEALGFAALLEIHGGDYRLVADRVGKSVRYVTKRVGLASVSLPVQRAVMGGYITVGHAELLIGLPSADQYQALSRMLNEPVPDDDWAPTPMPIKTDAAPRPVDGSEFFEDDDDYEDEEAGSAGSMPTRPARHTVSELRSYLNREMLTLLDKVAFPKDDATLVLSAGACDGCLKRTSANQNLFADLTTDDHCLDRTCLKAKADAFYERQFDALVVDNRDMRPIARNWNGTNVDGTEALGTKDYSLLKTADECDHAIAGLVLDGIDKGALLDICVAKSCSVHKKERVSAQSSMPGSHAKPVTEKEKAKRKEEIRQAKIGIAIREETFLRLVDKFATKSADTAFDLKLIALEMFNRFSRKSKLCDAMHLKSKKTKGAYGYESSDFTGAVEQFCKEHRTNVRRLLAYVLMHEEVYANVPNVVPQATILPALLELYPVDAADVEATVRTNHPKLYAEKADPATKPVKAKKVVAKKASKSAKADGKMAAANSSAVKFPKPTKAANAASGEVGP